MALKTQPTDDDIAAFLAAIPDERRRADSEAVCRLMAEETGETPVLWGTAIVGFGRHHYRYASGREGDWMAVGFSPRKQNLTLYLMDGFAGYEELLAKLGRHSTGKSCLYIKRLEDVDTDVLREMVRASYRHTTAR
jgi:hypothetical protein